MATTPRTLHKRTNTNNAQNVTVQAEYIPRETWCYERVKAHQCIDFINYQGIPDDPFTKHFEHHGALLIKKLREDPFGKLELTPEAHQILDILCGSNDGADEAHALQLMWVHLEQLRSAHPRDPSVTEPDNTFQTFEHDGKQLVLGPFAILGGVYFHVKGLQQWRWGMRFTFGAEDSDVAAEISYGRRGTDNLYPSADGEESARPGDIGAHIMLGYKVRGTPDYEMLMDTEDFQRQYTLFVADKSLVSNLFDPNQWARVVHSGRGSLEHSDDPSTDGPCTTYRWCHPTESYLYYNGGRHGHEKQVQKANFQIVKQVGLVQSPNKEYTILSCISPTGVQQEVRICVEDLRSQPAMVRAFARIDTQTKWNTSLYPHEFFDLMVDRSVRFSGENLQNTRVLQSFGWNADVQANVAVNMAFYLDKLMTLEDLAVEYVPELFTDPERALPMPATQMPKHLVVQSKAIRYWIFMRMTRNDPELGVMKRMFQNNYMHAYATCCLGVMGLYADHFWRHEGPEGCHLPLAWIYSPEFGSGKTQSIRMVMALNGLHDAPLVGPAPTQPGLMAKCAMMHNRTVCIDDFVITENVRKWLPDMIRCVYERSGRTNLNGMTNVNSALMLSVRLARRARFHLPACSLVDSNSPPSPPPFPRPFVAEQRDLAETRRRGGALARPRVALRHSGVGRKRRTSDRRRVGPHAQALLGVHARSHDAAHGESQVGPGGDDGLRTVLAPHSKPQGSRPADGRVGHTPVLHDRRWVHGPPTLGALRRVYPVHRQAGDSEVRGHDGRRGAFGGRRGERAEGCALLARPARDDAPRTEPTALAVDTVRSSAQLPRCKPQTTVARSSYGAEPHGGDQNESRFETLGRAQTGQLHRRSKLPCQRRHVQRARVAKSLQQEHARCGRAHLLH